MAAKVVNENISEYTVMAEKDQELLEFIVKALVDSPDKVEVKRSVDEMGTLLSLKVDAGDMGQIIGRDGSTARAIRTLIRIIGLKNHARVNLKIEEPEGGRRPPAAEKTEGKPAKAPQEEKKEEVEDEKKDSLEDLKL